MSSKDAQISQILHYVTILYNYNNIIIILLYNYIISNWKVELFEHDTILTAVQSNEYFSIQLCRLIKLYTYRRCGYCVAQKKSKSIQTYYAVNEKSLFAQTVLIKYSIFLDISVNIFLVNKNMIIIFIYDLIV